MYHYVLIGPLHNIAGIQHPAAPAAKAYSDADAYQTDRIQLAPPGADAHQADETQAAQSEALTSCGSMLISAAAMARGADSKCSVLPASGDTHSVMADDADLVASPQSPADVAAARERCVAEVSSALYVCS